MVVETLKKELLKLEGHDVLVIIAILVLVLLAVRTTDSLTYIEARSFFRNSLINVAVLLLVADLIMHVGRLEERILKEEEVVLAEEKKIVEEEKLIEREMAELGIKAGKTSLNRIIKKKKK